MKWRLVTHQHIRSSAAEIDDRWSCDDVVEAHRVADVLDEEWRRRNPERG